MAKSCVIIPSVINPTTGQKEESVLYKQINQYTFGDYQSSKGIYLATLHSKQFIDRKNKINDRLNYNSQGEIELESLLSNWDVSEHINEQRFQEKMLRYFDIENSIQYTQDTYQETLRKCNQLNKSIYGVNYVVYPQRINNAIEIRVEKRSSKNSKKNLSDSINKESTLYDKIKTILSNWGVSVGALDELEERLYNGTIDFTVSERAANGLAELIRIAKGVKGENALPEEFAHFIVRAMENNPLMKRTLKLIKDKNLTRGILGDELFSKYSIEYNNDADLLAEEAAGKLLAIHFLMNEGISDEALYSSILPKTINAIEKYFSKFDEEDLITAINEVNDNFSLIAEQVSLNQVELDAKNVRLGNSLKQLNQNEERIKSLKKLNEGILSNEYKRLKLLRMRKASDEEINLQKQLIIELQDSIRNRDTATVISDFSTNAIEVLKDTLKRLQSLSKAQASVNVKAGALRILRDNIKSFAGVIDKISKTVARDDAFDNHILNDQVRENVKLMTDILRDCNTQLAIQSEDIFRAFVKTYMGENIEVNGKKLTIDDVVELKLNDINFWDTWLDSMTESNSPLLNIFSKSTKERKTNARLRAINVYKEIVALTKQLERDGYKNQDFIFERDENGNQSGWYMSEINRTKFYKELEDFKKQERAKYGEKMSFAEQDKYNRAVNNWLNNHMELTPSGYRLPRKDLYRNYEYDKLNATQKEYLKKFLELKQKLDNLLDANTNLYKTIKIRKDLLERVRDSYDLKSAFGAFMDTLKEKFIDSSSDTDLGVYTTLRDFEDNEIRMLPIFYTSLRKGEKESDVSMDAVSTLSAYAAMATEFDEMSTIVSMLEVSRSYIKDSDGFMATRGSKGVEEPIGNGTLNQPLRVKNSNTVKKLDNWFESNVYHRYMKDEGTIGNSNISKAKTANAVNAYSAMMQMSFNLLSGISNVATGMVQMRIESVAGQFFKRKDVVWADSKFAKELVEYTGDVGSRVKTSWLSLMNEKFNVMQDYEQDAANRDYDKKWYNRLFSMDTTFFLQHIGEFWMQNRTFLSLIHSENEELINSTGKKVKIADAYTKQLINPNNVKDGAKIVLKSGLKYKDGRTIITEQELEERAKRQNKPVTSKELLKDNEMSEYEFVNKISRKSAAINNDMHGIYNKEDMNAFQRLAIGRMVMMYRKWIKPSLNRRFKKGYYNYDLESYREGYYRSAFVFMKRLKEDLVKHQLFEGGAWNSLNDVQKSNVMKALYEVAFFVALVVLTSLVFGGDDDDDTENSFAWNMAHYQARRLINEIGVLIPGPSMLQEGLKILDSPMAGVQAVQKILNLTDLIWIPNWFDEVERGRYKGTSRAMKTIYECIPFNKTIYRGLHPDEGIAWFIR